MALPLVLAPQIFRPWNMPVPKYIELKVSEQDQGTISNPSLPGLHVCAFQFQLLLPHQGGRQKQVI